MSTIGAKMVVIIIMRVNLAAQLQVALYFCERIMPLWPWKKYIWRRKPAHAPKNIIEKATSFKPTTWNDSSGLNLS